MPWQAPVTFQNAENQEPLTWPEESGWHSAPAFPPFSAPPFSVLSAFWGQRFSRSCSPPFCRGAVLGLGRKVKGVGVRRISHFL